MKHSMRQWHTWASLVLGLPLILVGLTTFFIAHDKALGTRDVMLPGTLASPEPPEVRAVAWVGNEQWIGTRQGVFRLKGGDATAVAGAPGDEIRAISAANGQIILAGKKGLWLLESGQSTRTHKDDCWQLTHHPVQGFSAACKSGGFLTSPDGRQWDSPALSFDASTIAASASTAMPLSKLVMDLHTGKFFLGKDYEWIWIDLLGLACVGLGLTGLVMWMRGRRQRTLAR